MAESVKRVNIQPGDVNDVLIGNVLADIADENPERVRQMSADYSTWAKRVGVRPWPMPETPRGSERTGAMSAPDYLLKDRM